MSMLAEGLARCERVGAAAMAAAAGLEGRVEPAVLAHPLVVRFAGDVSSARVRQVLELNPPPHVVDDVLALTSAEGVVALAQERPSPRLLAAAQVVAEGDGDLVEVLGARSVLLRVGPEHLRRGLVSTVAPLATDASGLALVWLAAAVQCPDLLADLVDVVPTQLVEPVSRLAAVAASGGSPVETFAADAIGWARSGGRARPDWAKVAGELGLVPSWPALVASTGLVSVAAAALESWPFTEVHRQVLIHPHLAGTTVQGQSRAWLVQALGCGPLPDAVLAERAGLLDVDSPVDVMDWLGRGREGVGDVAFAWASLRRLADGPGDDTRTQQSDTSWWALMAAAALACADAPEGGVWAPALEWVHKVRGEVLAANANINMDPVQRLVDLAQRVHGGDGLGSVAVADLARVRATMWAPTWLGRLLGEFFAGVPGVDDPAFVTGVLGCGDQFAGTFDELVTVAAAVAA